LRKLVEACLAEYNAELRDTWIAAHFEGRATHLVEMIELCASLLGVMHHGAKLVEPKDPSS
jgi:hypothetical protein